MQWPYATPCHRHGIMIKFSSCEEGKLSMVKLSRFAKIRENCESFPPRMFCGIRYKGWASGRGMGRVGGGWRGWEAGGELNPPNGPFGVAMCPRSASHRPRQD